MDVAAEFGAPAAAPVAAAPAAAASGPALDESSVTQALLALISDRTGYPTDMLDPDLNLEADLGIDSIKRVEILGALRGDLLPDSGEDAREKMGPVSRERTVRGIVAKFMDVAAEFSGAPAPQAAPVRAVAAVPDPEPEVPADQWGARFVMKPCAVAAPKPKDWVVPGATYVLTDDGAGVASALAKRIESQGGTPLLLGDAVDLSDDAAIRAAVAPVAGNTVGLIHCAPLRAAGDVLTAPVEDWRKAVDISTRALYSLLSALGGTLSARPEAVVISLSTMGGAFGFDGAAPENPAQGGAPGLLKTAAKEWEKALVRALDFAPGTDAETIVAHVFDEAGRRDGLTEIGFDGEERQALFAEKNVIDPETAPKIELDESSVVLVTGGARGITAKIALHLAKAYKPRFILMGSSPVPEAQEAPELARAQDDKQLKAALIARAKAAGQPVTPAAIESAFRTATKAREIRTAMATIEATGAKVDYVSCDVRDAAAFKAAIDGVYASHGRIDGVLHGAGVIEDKLILDKEVSSFDNVVRLKTESALVLAQSLKPKGLKFLVFFTSVAGRFGNRGQGDYGAANETVSKLARLLAARWPDAGVCAISWGPWDSGGMVSDEIKAQFNAMRIEPIAPAHGTRALELEVTRAAPGAPEVVWGRGPWEDDMELYKGTYGGPPSREAAE